MAIEHEDKVFLEDLQRKFDNLSYRLGSALTEFLKEATVASECDFVGMCINSRFACHFGAFPIEFDSNNTLISALLESEKGLWRPVRKIVEQRAFFFLREVDELRKLEIYDPSKITSQMGKDPATLLDLILDENVQNELKTMVDKFRIRSSEDEKVLSECLEDIKTDNPKHIYRNIYWRVCDPDIYALIFNILEYAQKSSDKQAVLKYLKTAILEPRLNVNEKEDYLKVDNIANIWWILKVLYINKMYDSNNKKMTFNNFCEQLAQITGGKPFKRPLNFEGQHSEEKIIKYRPNINITPELFDNRWGACFSAINIMDILERTHSLINVSIGRTLYKLLRDILKNYVLKRDEDGLFYYYALKLRCINQYLRNHLKKELMVFYPEQEIEEYKEREKNVFTSDLNTFQVSQNELEQIQIYSTNENLKNNIKEVMGAINSYSLMINNGKGSSLKPLTIFLCAEPGSGKSYLVEQIGKGVNGRSLLSNEKLEQIIKQLSKPNSKRKPLINCEKKVIYLELNLSQISTWNEIYNWLNIVAGIIDKYPKLLVLLFFDEIDSLPEEIQIYSRLLGPLADGKFLDISKNIARKCSPVIWFFAASKVKNFADLKR